VLFLWIQSNKGYMKLSYIFTISCFSSSFKMFMCMGSEKSLKQFIYNSYPSPCVWFSIPSMPGCNLFKYGRFACILWLRKGSAYLLHRLAPSHQDHPSTQHHPLVQGLLVDLQNNTLLINSIISPSSLQKYTKSFRHTRN